MPDHPNGCYLGPDDNPDKYCLLQQFGAGGEAQLWKAALTVAGGSEPVALKVLRPERLDDVARCSGRWAEQAELLRFVRHPGVVGIREHFEGAPAHAIGGAARTPGRSLCLVMNWVEGHSLRDWVPLNPGPEGLVRGLNHLEQLAEVLDWLHSGRATPSGRVVVHGDLSPGNVMISAAGQATLVDFGLVRIAAHGSAAAAGTPGFAAPEVWRTGDLSPAADRYGFGAVAYFLLTGENPPADPAALGSRLTALPILAGGGPERLAHLVRIFSDDPAWRPPALEWVRMLRGSVTSSTRTTLRLPPPTPPVSTAFLPEAPPASTARFPDAPPPTRRRGRKLLVSALVSVSVSVTVVVGTTITVRGNAEVPGTAVPGGPAAPVTTSAAPTLVPTTTLPTPAEGTLVTAPVGPGAITYLADLHPIDGHWYDSGTIAVDGKTYAHAVLDQGCYTSEAPRSIEYDLGRHYQDFTTVIGMSDNTDSDAVSQVEFFVDGLPAGKFTVKRGTVTPVAFSVRGALTLKVTVSTITGAKCQSNDNGLTLADPKLVS